MATDYKEERMVVGMVVGEKKRRLPLTKHPQELGVLTSKWRSRVGQTGVVIYEAIQCDRYLRVSVDRAAIRFAVHDDRNALTKIACEGTLILSLSGVATGENQNMAIRIGMQWCEEWAADLSLAELDEKVTA